MNATGEPTTGTSLDDGHVMVVGLEVHAELATATKLFSAAPNAYGDEPNTNIGPGSLGLPGALPVLNRYAVELAIRLGLALNCTIRRSVFARKNYFYPDMATNYQISQSDRPINVDGHLQLPSGRRIGIERAHLEEDTGKSTHMGGTGRISGSSYSLVDYNRAGVPLLEIVSRPDITSPEEARSYVAELRAILVATGVSDGRMEEGSLRVDANVSVHRPGEPLGVRSEIKNLNSLRSLTHAIDHEARRQVAALAAGESLRQETRLWNEQTQRTETMRAKEDADDYRYFDDPDLVPVDPDPAWIERIRATLPLLPAARRARLSDAVGSDAADSVALIVERGADDLAVEAIEAGAPGDRVLVHVEQHLADVDPATVSATDLAALIGLEVAGELTATQAKQVLTHMLEAGGDPAEIAKELGFEAMTEDALATVVDEVIAANPEEWERFRDGDDKTRGKLTGFFVGQVMRATRGQADGGAATRLLRSRLDD